MISTRSKSQSTFVAHTRLDAKDVASVLHAFLSEGIVPQSVSHLISMIVRVYAASLRKAGRAEVFNSLQEALEFLSEHGFQQRGKENQTLLAEQLMQESVELSEEQISSSIHPTPTNPKSPSPGTEEGEEVELLERIMRRPAESGIAGQPKGGGS